MQDSNKAKELAGLLTELHSFFQMNKNSWKKRVNDQSSTGSYGDLNNDIETEADYALSEFILNYLKQIGFGGKVVIEGWEDGPVKLGDESYTLYVDPADGSLNHEVSIFGWDSLPLTAVLTLVEETRVGEGKFSDIVFAACLDYRNGNMMVANKESSGEVKTYLVDSNQDWILSEFTNSPTKIDLGKYIVMFEPYYHEDRDLVSLMFSGENGYLRSPGSAAFEMAYMASGQAIAAFCTGRKGHELGFGYLATIGAGGVVCDFSGKDLSTKQYSFNSRQEVILAVNQSIADDLISRYAEVGEGMVGLTD